MPPDKFYDSEGRAYKVSNANDTDDFFVYIAAVVLLIAGGFVLIAVLSPIAAPILLHGLGNARRQGDSEYEARWFKWTWAIVLLAVFVAILIAGAIANYAASILVSLGWIPLFPGAEFLTGIVALIVALPVFFLSLITILTPTIVVYANQRAKELDEGGGSTKAGRLRKIGWLFIAIAGGTITLAVAGCGLAAVVYLFGGLMGFG